MTARMSLPKETAEMETQGVDQTKGGFSLTELLMVLAIMMILMGIALPNLTSMQASYRLDGSARGVSALIQRTHFDAISDSTGYRILLYPSNSGTSPNSYKRQRVFPQAPFLLTAGSTYVDDTEAIALPTGVDMTTDAPEVSTGVNAIIFDSAGDVIDLDGNYISSDLTITVTNSVGNTSEVLVSGTSHVRIQ
jgi:prepilin-type N-terminal cleavage/methylation domain-containing protein